jgi:hypothetical protein
MIRRKAEFMEERAGSPQWSPERPVEGGVSGRDVLRFEVGRQVSLDERDGGSPGGNPRATELPPAGVRTARRAVETTVDALRTEVDQALDRMSVALSGVQQRFVNVAGPDEVSVQFGLKVGVGGTLVVATGTAEANVSVTATWRRRPEGGDSRP